MSERTLKAESVFKKANDCEPKSREDQPTQQKRTGKLRARGFARDDRNRVQDRDDQNRD